MTAVDDYLVRASRSLAGMDSAVRDDILRELRSHLADAVADSGEKAVASAEAPELVARRYKELYGYGRTYQAVFVAIAAALAVPTLPLLLYSGAGSTVTFGVSLLFLGLLVTYLMAVAVKAGSRVGLAAGVAACVARFVSLAVLSASAGAVVPDANAWILFLAISVVLVAIGYVPGRAKERWHRHEVGL